jgi:Dullard-like phosphatase family protein
MQKNKNIDIQEDIEQINSFHKYNTSTNTSLNLNTSESLNQTYINTDSTLNPKNEKKNYVYKRNIVLPKNSCFSPNVKRNKNNHNNKHNNNIINSNKGILRSSSSENMKKNMIIKSNKSFDNSQNNINTIKENSFINIEDLLLLEEKFNDVYHALINKSVNLPNECFELLNYYNNSSLYDRFENYFIDFDSKTCVHQTILFIMYNVMFIYNIFFDNNFLSKCNEILINLITLNHKGYLILCEYILTKISASEKNNIWVQKLKIMLAKNLKRIDLNNNDYIQFIINKENDITNVNNLTEMKYYIYQISNLIKVIIKNNKQDKLNNDFYQLFKNISINNVFIKSNDLNNFFRKNVIRVINKNASVMGSEINPLESNLNNNLKIPYITSPPKKNLTLVLDLDETLISFQTDIGDETKGLLRFRPYLFQFLEKMINYYELIIFTSATNDYAEPIIEVIERDNKYFDYILCRQHTIVVNNDFVKDISLIGRDLKKMIIVDNMQQNFRNQKENGIFIKPFWGEDTYDCALNNLGEILEDIAKNYSNDVRKGLVIYKDEILNKVSSNFARDKNLMY